MLKNLAVKTVPKDEADFYTRSKPRVAEPKILK